MSDKPTQNLQLLEFGSQSQSKLKHERSEFARELKICENLPKSFQTCSDPPMQDWTQECHQEGCCEDEGGIKVQKGSPEDLNFTTPLFRTLPETGPSTQKSSISKTARQVPFLSIIWPEILLFRLSSCMSICPFRACPRSYRSSTRRRPRGTSSRQRGTLSPTGRRGLGKTEEADIGLEELYKHAEPRWKFDL